MPRRTIRLSVDADQRLQSAVKLGGCVPSHVNTPQIIRSYSETGGFSVDISLDRVLATYSYFPSTENASRTLPSN
jgi:hypothetical protein